MTNDGRLQSLLANLERDTEQIGLLLDEKTVTSLKQSADDEDVVAFASPKASDDVLDGRLNRITGEALIHFLTDPLYEFHGRCHRAQPLF